MPNFCRFAVLAALVAAVAPATAEARSAFDGPWLVVIRSMTRGCPVSSSYPLHIRDGLVSYRGLVPVKVEGRVDAVGRVTVRLDGGDQWARAAGRLSSRAGAGTWRGKAQRRACAGQWWAHRR